MKHPVYRVFTIIKHCKILGPRLVLILSPIDLKSAHTCLLIKDYRCAKFYQDRLRNDGDTVAENPLWRKIRKK